MKREEVRSHHRCLSLNDRGECWWDVLSRKTNTKNFLWRILSLLTFLSFGTTVSGDANRKYNVAMETVCAFHLANVAPHFPHPCLFPSTQILRTNERDVRGSIYQTGDPRPEAVAATHDAASQLSTMSEFIVEKLNACWMAAAPRLIIDLLQS